MNTTIENEGKNLTQFQQLTDSEKIHTAQTILREKKGIGDIEVTNIIKSGRYVWDSEFEFMDLNHGGTKIVRFNSFVSLPRIKSSDELSMSTTYGAFTVNKVFADLPVKGDANRFAVKFYSVHEKSDFELIGIDHRGFLVKHHCHGGFYKRYKSFDQVLKLDAPFNTLNKGPYYIGIELIKNGYYVEMEYTIPGTRRRIDMAIYTDEGLTDLVGFVEFDGAQHFESLSVFGDDDEGEALRERQEIDKSKETYAIALEKPMVRVDHQGTAFTKEGARACVPQIITDLKTPILPEMSFPTL